MMLSPNKKSNYKGVGLSDKVATIQGTNITSDHIIIHILFMKVI